MAKETLKKRHFLVSGCQSARLGLVEALIWNDKKIDDRTYGVYGIDDISYKDHIGDDIYQVIEYDPDDGIVRVGEEGLKIRRGTVVYFSENISDVQKWLEDHGARYFGYGANLVYGDNSIIKAGPACHIKAGNNCKIYAGDWCHIIAGDKCHIECGSDSFVKTGKKSYVVAQSGSRLSGGEGSSFRWETNIYTKKMIALNEADKIFLGVYCDTNWMHCRDDSGKWVVKEPKGWE